jgi:Yip1 domain
VRQNVRNAKPFTRQSRFAAHPPSNGLGMMRRLDSAFEEGAVDFNKLLARVKNILLTPKTEWPVIALEPETVAGLYKNYILILAAIPAVIGFIKGSLLGYSMFGVSVRAPIGQGLVQMILMYIVGLASVYVAALIADALAPTFGAQKSQVQALKATAYAWTATWIASVGLLLGLAIGGLIGLLALGYAFYLLYLGLQNTMKSPQDRAAGYTAVVVIVTIVVVLIASLLLRPLGFGGFGGMNSMSSYSDPGSVTVDRNSAIGALAAMGQRAAEAGKKMDAAQKSGDANAQAAAAGAVLGAVLGGGDQVESLTPDMLKPFLPETLGGIPRVSFEASRNAPIGIQVSNAEATYRNAQGAELRLEITDTGGAKGIMALAGFAGMEEDKQTESGYEKTYHQGGNLIHEEWNKSGSGEYTVIVGGRFVVAVHGSGLASIDTLKAALSSVNLSGLEALKGQGVKRG